MTSDPKSNYGFELRDHTADIALFAYGETQHDLFVAAAEGLYATIGELQSSRVGRCDSITLSAPDPESLLQDFLSELLYRFEVRSERLTNIEIVALQGDTLTFSASVKTVDRDASVFDREVKAVTYHDVRIENRNGQYEVTIILDI